jgi:membrane protease YdiL (CAAX protease family)
LSTDLKEPRDSREAPWGAWATIGFGILVVITALIVQGVVAFSFILAEFGLDEEADIDPFVKDLQSDGLFLSTATLVSAPICIGIIILFVKLRRGPSVRRYLRIVPIAFGTLVKWLGITALVLAAMAGVNYLLDTPMDDFMVDAYETAGIVPLLWVTIILVAPLFEEILFRGFLFAGLHNSRVGAVGAILLTSLLWALLHVQYGIQGLSMILVIGILLGIARLRTDSIYTPFAMHAFYNLVAMIELAAYVAS